MKKQFDSAPVIKEVLKLLKQRNAMKVGTKKYLKVNSRIQILKARLRKNGFNVPSDTSKIGEMKLPGFYNAVATPNLKDVIFDQLVEKMLSELNLEDVKAAVVTKAIDKIKKQA